MSDISKKIVGWVLLAAGVLAIAWGIWSSAQIFTAKTTAPEIFKEPIVKESSLAGKKAVSAEEQMQEQMQNVISEQISKLMPAESVTGLLNLIAWSVFMTILIFAAGKIAGIGIKLLT